MRMLQRTLRGPTSESAVLIRTGAWTSNEYGERVQEPGSRTNLRCKVKSMSKRRLEATQELDPPGARATEAASFFFTVSARTGDKIEARGRRWTIVGVMSFPEHGVWECESVSGQEDFL